MDLFTISNMDKSQPDYHIELFWYGFKTSMFNFYQKFKINRPVELWSKTLNNLQKEKKYKIIEKKIKNFIGLYAIDLMRFGSSYHTQILDTNIKRWNNISHFHLDIENSIKYHNIIFLLFDIYKNLITKKSLDEKKIRNIFSEVELFLIYEDFTSLIIFSVDQNIYSVIDKLYKYYGFDKINNKIKEIYNIEKIPAMKTKKLLNYLKFL